PISSPSIAGCRKSPAAPSELRRCTCYAAMRTALMPAVKSTIRIVLVLLLGAVIQKPAITLAAPQTQATGRTLLATVMDVSGKTQVDVGVDDFLVKEGGDEREVLDVHIADYPIVMLIDDGPGSNDLRPIKSAIARFIARIGERPVAIGTLTRPTEFIASLEDSRENVLERLTNMNGIGADASTLPAVAHAARALKDTGSPFSAIVVVTGRAIDARV